MTIKKIITQTSIITITLIAFFLFLNTTPSLANTSCTPVYGGGETCVGTGNLNITKLVQNPSTGAYVNNLGINNPEYASGQDVNFQLIVTNTGSTTFSQVNVSDIFPQYLRFVSGPGSFNASNQTLSFTTNNLTAGASQTFNVVGQVISSDKLPSGEKVICVANLAQAQANDGETSQSNAQFCISQPISTTTQVETVPNITSTPPTGPEDLPLLMLIPIAIAGITLRKQAWKNKFTNLFKKGGEK